MPNTKTGFIEVNGAQLYYELVGKGEPFVMIHAGIADSRMWNNEFGYYADRFQVLRFDMRGYGKSLPVEGEFNIQDDFVSLLNKLNINEPIHLMGCSIGAGLAIDFALTYPDRVKSLILVGGAPAGLEIEAEGPDDLFAQSDKAFEDKKIELVAETDMQIWFDGMGRSKEDVDPVIRQLVYEMARLVTEHEVKGIGTHVRKEFENPAVDRLDELIIPTLLIIGDKDIPYLLLAADYMEQHMPNASKVVIPNTAHLPNMEQPEIFRNAVDTFLKSE